MSPRGLQVFAAGQSLPADTVTSTLIVYGGKGMGKTNLLSVLLEEMSKSGLRWCVVDPLGVLYGLRYGLDGKSPGVECLILGGVHGDIDIEPTGGEVVADLVADEDVNVIIDCSRDRNGQMWSVGQKIKFLTAFPARVFQQQGSLVNGRRRPPRFIGLDEAARYIPQNLRSGDKEGALCVSAWEQIVEEGRNVGLGVGLFTQRSARLNKSVAELADAMIAFRTTGPNSIDAITDWLGDHVEKSVIREHVEVIRKLPVGQALLVSPGWLEREEVVRFRARETFDSSATPKPGERPRRISGRGAAVDLDAYRQRMAATIQRADENDPRVLRKRVKELEVVMAKGAVVEVPREVVKTVEVPVITEADRELIERLTRHMYDASMKWSEIVHQVTSLADNFRDKVNVEQAGVVTTTNLTTSTRSRRGRVTPVPAPAASSPGRPAAKRVRGASAPATTSKLGKGEKKVLAVLTEYPEGVVNNRLAFLAGYSAKASTLSVILANLRREGLVTDGQPVKLTPAGVASAGGWQERPHGPELLRHWLQHPRMGEGERTVLQALIDLYPRDDVGHQELCEVTGYSPDASTMSVILAKLRKLGLVEKKGRRVVDEFMESIQ